MRRPTRAGRVWFSTPKPTTGLPHGGGSAMPLFSTMGATKITSRMSLLMTTGLWLSSLGPLVSTVYYQYTAVYLRVYGRIPGSIRPYTRSIRRKICADPTCCAPVACACAHGFTGQLAHICLAHLSTAIIVSNMFANAHQKEKGRCLQSIQDFCEGIKRRHLTPYAVCALHPQTSTPAPYFVSHVMAHPVFFTIGLRGKRATAKTFVDAIGSISIAW